MAENYRAGLVGPAGHEDAPTHLNSNPRKTRLQATGRLQAFVRHNPRTRPGTTGFTQGVRWRCTSQARPELSETEKPGCPHSACSRKDTLGSAGARHLWHLKGAKDGYLQAQPPRSRHESCPTGQFQLVLGEEEAWPSTASGPGSWRVRIERAGSRQAGTALLPCAVVRPEDTEASAYSYLKRKRPHDATGIEWAEGGRGAQEGADRQWR